MTVTIRRPAPHAYTVVAPPYFDPRVRLWKPGKEMGFVAKSWRESYKDSPTTRGMHWADYKALVVPQLDAALDRPDTRVHVVVDPTDFAVGWCASASWPSIAVVHWVFVAPRYRGRGLMRVLLDVAVERPNVVYTHKAKVRRDDRPRSDRAIATMLRARGATVSYISYAEWSR